MAALTVTDKRSGQTYTRLLTFEDRADIGDGWNYGPAVNDQSFTTTASRSAVALVQRRPLPHHLPAADGDGSAGGV